MCMKRDYQLFLFILLSGALFSQGFCNDRDIDIVTTESNPKFTEGIEGRTTFKIKGKEMLEEVYSHIYSHYEIKILNRPEGAMLKK